MANYGTSGYGQQQQGYGPGYGPPQGWGPPPIKKTSGCMTFLIVCACLFGGCVTLGIVGKALDDGKPKPSSATASTTSPAATKASVAADETPQPTVTVTAAKLFTDYQANEVSADSKYKNQRLAVSGTVSSIRKDFTDSIVVELATAQSIRKRTREHAGPRGARCWLTEQGAIQSSSIARARAW